MNTTTAAQTAGVTRDTIRTWARMGAIKATKQVGRWVIDPVSLAKRIVMGAKQPQLTRKVTMKATDITFTTEGASTYLSAPYNPAANSDYKALGGRWDGGRKEWRFAARDIDRVRAVLLNHFGYDDRPVETVDVRVALEGEYGRGHGTDLRMFGRTIASRAYRDDDVRLGRDVILIEGEFDPSAGSMNYPAIGDVDGIVLEVRGVPAHHEDLNDDGVTVLDAPDENKDEAERAALEAEKAALLARLAEIDALLAR